MTAKTKSSKKPTTKKKQPKKMPTISRAFKKTYKQIEAIDLMSQYPEIDLAGGSRSGKTFISVYAIFVRMLKYPGSSHLIARKHFNHLKSIITQTIPDVNKKAFGGALDLSDFNKTDWILTFPNGSKLYFVGTEDKDRLEKVLGLEFDTIFINEASQITYNIYETLKTRLNPQAGVKPLLITDLNPTNKRHFIYKLFFLKQDPETGQPLLHPERYATLQMNPIDNVVNLSAAYIENLESMSEAKRKRFLKGEFSDDSENALWRWEWIIKQRVNTAPDMDTVIIAVDPAVTDKATSDDTGIIVVGRHKIDGENHYYVTADKTYHGHVSEWGAAVARAYKDYLADRVIGEVNQGGDLVEMNIRNYDKNIAYSDVRATRGKAVRAEPVADLYRRGFVHHVGEFPELEDELTSWIPGDEKSPNRLDALVWGVTWLSGMYETDFSVGIA